jgi:hypothetical protein
MAEKPSHVQRVSLSHMFEIGFTLFSLFSHIYISAFSAVLFTLFIIHFLIPNCLSLSLSGGNRQMFVTIVNR